MIGRLAAWRMIYAGLRRQDGQEMGLLKKLCDMFDEAWEDFVYDPATQLPTLLDPSAVDVRWLPMLKPLLGFTRDMPFEATEEELRRILSRAAQFWSDKPSELGCVDHAVRMVTGGRFRIRNYFDHRIECDKTCVTEELEDFDPSCIDFPSRAARGLTVTVGGCKGANHFQVEDGLDRPFETPYDYRYLVVEEPAQYRRSYEIDRLVPDPSSLEGYTKRALFPTTDSVECVASLYGAMDEYVTEVRVVDDRHGKLNFDGETYQFTPGERVRGTDSRARATVVAVERAGTSGTLTIGRVYSRFWDNEELVGARGGSARAKGRAYEILNRELLSFLLETNRVGSERYDLVYIQFLDEFKTPNDLDQWTCTGGVTVPEPGGAAHVPPGGRMICNDPRAPLVDVG